MDMRRLRNGQPRRPDLRGMRRGDDPAIRSRHRHPRPGRPRSTATRTGRTTTGARASRNQPRADRRGRVAVRGEHISHGSRSGRLLVHQHAPSPNSLAAIGHETRNPGRPAVDQRSTVDPAAVPVPVAQHHRPQATPPPGGLAPAHRLDAEHGGPSSADLRWSHGGAASGGERFLPEGIWRARTLLLRGGPEPLGHPA
jgi:hypothetical protein